jgi:hypothetical protein
MECDECGGGSKNSGNLKIKILNPHYDRSKATGEGGMFQLFAYHVNKLCKIET